MTHRGLVEESETVIGDQLSVTEEASHGAHKGHEGKAELGIRINCANARHHLWNNNGTWFIHYTVYPTPVTAKRVRRSLKTKSLKLAMQRRDAILGKEGHLAKRKEDCLTPGVPASRAQGHKERAGQGRPKSSIKDGIHGRGAYGGERRSEAAFIGAYI